MKSNQNLFWAVCVPLGILCSFFSCNQEQEIPIVTDFEYSIPEAGYTVPVVIAIANKTTGADFYQWTFEGGVPKNSAQKSPIAKRVYMLSNWKHGTTPSAK
jgi:hypothetical protein